MKRIIMLLLACCLLVGAAAAAGGEGTAANPYIIETPAELLSIQNNLAAYYVLGNDIDMQGISFNTIGSPSAPFTGSFDGNGHTISNLYGDNPSNYYNYGFFSSVSGNAVIKDITFDNIQLESTTTRLAIVCGGVLSNSDVTFSEITVSNSILLSTAGNIAGIVAQIQESDVTISGCNVISCKFSSQGAGGNNGFIAGWASKLQSLTISNCNIYESIIYASGNYNGGVIGFFNNNPGDITIIDVIIQNCICYSLSGDCIAGCIGYLECGSTFAGNTVSISNINIINTILRGVGNCAGIINILGSTAASASISITECNIDSSSIVSSSSSAVGFVIGFSNNDNIQSSQIVNSIINGDITSGVCL